MNEHDVMTLGGHTRKVDMRVIGDTPERHSHHLIWDATQNTVTESNGGLAFTLGVACMEAELCKDDTRVWEVQHPNGVSIYHVSWLCGGIRVTNIGSGG